MGPPQLKRPPLDGSADRTSMPAVFLWTTIPFVLATIFLALIARRFPKTIIWLAALVVGILFGGAFFLSWQQAGPERLWRELAVFLAMYTVPLAPAAAGLSRLKDRGRISAASVGTIALLSAVIGVGWCYLIYIQGCSFGWTDCP